MGNGRLFGFSMDKFSEVRPRCAVQRCSNSPYPTVPGDLRPWPNKIVFR